MDDRFFVLLGAFDELDPARWRVEDRLQLLPSECLQLATAHVIIAG
jgi:hypothetical protein